AEFFGSGVYFVFLPGAPGFFTPFLEFGWVAGFEFLIDATEKAVDGFFNPGVALAVNAGCAFFPSSRRQVPFGPFFSHKNRVQRSGLRNSTQLEGSGLLADRCTLFLWFLKRFRLVCCSATARCWAMKRRAKRW